MRGRQLGNSQNGRQNIIEIVGNTAGQGADRLHFLRLPQLLRQLLTFVHLCLQLCQCRRELRRALLDTHFQGLMGGPQCLFGTLAFSDFCGELCVKVVNPPFFSHHRGHQVGVVKAQMHRRENDAMQLVRRVDAD